MKSSGQAVASFSPEASSVASGRPAIDSAGQPFPLYGLSGQSEKWQWGEKVCIARNQAQNGMVPGVSRRREYRILRRLADSGLAPTVCGYDRNRLLLTWQPGEYIAHLDAHLPALIPRLIQLHHQPLSGYRVLLLPLLERYWQLVHPARRHIAWQRALRHCRRTGEPRPLRLALLHLDIHAGNLIEHNGCLHLIDWEYAGDGDVALELAVTIAGNTLTPEKQAFLVAHYAESARLDSRVLSQKIACWLPWVRLLIASWYELRWQQSSDHLFHALAAQAWQRI